MLKTVSTYYYGTYTLASGTLDLTVTSTGSIQADDGRDAHIFKGATAATSGGIGVDAPHFAVINNGGAIAGGNGGSTSVAAYPTAGNGGVGVYFAASGDLNNTNSISGGAGGNSTDGAGGAGGAGVVFRGTAFVTNSEAIAGGNGGNGHAVGGAGGNGITFYGSASLQNEGFIQGGNAGNGETAGVAGDGVYLGNGGSITDAGFIVGGGGGEVPLGKGGFGETGGTGVDLANGGTLNVDQGGTVEGGAGGAGFSGGFGGIGVDLVNGGTLNVEQGGTVMGGDGRASGGVGVYLNGGSLTNDGTIEGGTGGSQGDSVLFGASPATMIVGLGAQFDGSIGGFHHGDYIDLQNVPLGDVTDHFNPSTDTVSVYTQLDGTLQFAGDPNLIFSSNGSGGTEISCACFRRGTLILTENGERPVELLEIGDRVMTLSGGLRPIRWIGQRHYSGQALLERPDVMPVLIRAGALGDHLPKRDLWVSPEHALYLSGGLTPVGLLTNGVSILTDHSVGSVSYYHLEFESHEVVFAEGTPAESFVDDDSRQMFDNAADYAFRYPDAPRQSAIFCASRVEDGEELEALRVKLTEIAAIPVPLVRVSAPATIDSLPTG